MLREIGEAFTKLRHTNRTAAWSDLQERLMSNISMLVPNVVTLKDFIGLGIDIESFVKNDSGAVAEEPLEVIRKFLNSPDGTLPLKKLN